MSSIRVWGFGLIQGSREQLVPLAVLLMQGSGFPITFLLMQQSKTLF